MCGIAHVALEPLDLTRINSQAALFRSLFARSKQRLHPQTDSQERNAAANRFDQRPAHVELVQRAHHLPKVSDARQNELGRLANARGIADQFVIRPDRTERVLHRAQIPGAVIENRNHNNPLVEGNWSFNRAIRRARIAHGPRETLEDRLDLVMVRPSIQNLGVQIRARVIHEAAEEIFDQFGLQIAHQPDSHAILIHQRRPPAEIDRHHRQRFVHRQHEVARAIDAFAVPERLREQLSQRDADVFDRVVLVDIQVPGGFQLQIKPAVLGKQLQHVIEEADAG